MLNCMFGEKITEQRARLELTTVVMAELYGVPLVTYQKWVSSGKERRDPGAATYKLYEVLTMLEVVAPAILNNLIEEAIESVRKRRIKR